MFIPGVNEVVVIDAGKRSTKATTTTKPVHMATKSSFSRRNLLGDIGFLLNVTSK